LTEKGKQWEKALGLLQQMLHRKNADTERGELEREHQRVREGQAVGGGAQALAGDGARRADDRCGELKFGN